MKRAKLHAAWEMTVCIANAFAPGHVNPYRKQETLPAEAGFHAMKAAIKGNKK